MKEQEKKILREEALKELKRELAMRVQVWAQSKPADESGPHFRDKKHTQFYARLEAVLQVIQALSPGQFYELWNSEPYQEPKPSELF